MPTCVSVARVTLAPEPAAVGQARRFFRDHQCPQRDAERMDVAVLLVSELVTNAIRHGAPPITLELECDEHHFLQVSVTDSSTALPTTRHAEAEDADGRGLTITELLSDAWGVDPRRDGKTVWFRLLPDEDRSPR